MLLCRVNKSSRGDSSRSNDRFPGMIRSLTSLSMVVCMMASAVMPICSQTTTNPTTINLATQGRNPDFSTFTLTRPMSVGAILPATCVVGQLFFDTGAAAGQNIYGCTAINTWTVQGGGSSKPAVGAASFSSSSLTFSSQQDGSTSAAQTVTLTNSGAGALTISSIGTGGTNGKDFTQSNNCGSSLAVGATCTVTVAFDPSTTGTESAVVSLSDNATNSPQSISLSGTGVSGPVLTPSALTAAVGTPLTVTADRSVTWALASGSVGTLSNNSATSVVYTPPGSITAKNVQGGCAVSPSDSIFNTRIDNLPVNANSAQWTTVMNNPISFFPTMGTNVLDNTVPSAPQTFYYTSAYNNTPFQIAPKPSRKRETGSLTTDGNNDHHLISVNHQTCQFYETYQDGGSNPYCSQCTAQSGITYAGSSYGLPTNGSTDAAGLPLEPLLIHLSELEAGAINHAMRFTLCTGCINSAGFLWPATAANGSTTPTAPMNGTRFRLKSSFVPSGVNSISIMNNGSGYTTAPTITITGCQVTPVTLATVSGGALEGITVKSPGSGCVNPTVTIGGPGTGAVAQLNTYTPMAQTILVAMQQYGIIVADNGTTGSIQTSTDLDSDPVAVAALSQIASSGLLGNVFEAVDESSLMISPNSTQVNPSNSYVTPSNYAVLVATDSNGYKTSVPVAIQPVTVGVPWTTMTFVAGNTGYQLQSWVNGSTNQSVTWTLTSGPGTLTSAGVYTPPATIAGESTAVFTATAAADSTASVKVYATIIPSGSNPTGTIRIDVGNSSTYTDSTGNVWQPDAIASEMAGYSVQNDNYPSNVWGNITDVALYQTYRYTWGDDMFYGPFVVPNGDYKITLLFGMGECSGVYTGNTFDNGLVHGLLALETQGSIQLRIDPMAAVNDTCRVPYNVNIPAQVTNNLLTFAVRATGGQNAHSAPFLNAFSISPDSSTPTIAIDNQQVTTVNAGGTVQFYITSWYMSNSVTWSVSGGGTISQTGLYTAPATAPSSDTTITITATSTANSSVVATTTLTLLPASGS